MSNKPLNISESAAVQMPMKTVASLIVLVAMGVFAYTELTSRLVSLETSRELFENDLLKKSEQVPVDQEQHFLLEDLYKSVEQIETRIEDMMHNKVNIQFIQKQTEKLLEDVEVLKDKVRANKNGNGTSH
jgi:TolA-binding protein